MDAVTEILSLNNASKYAMKAFDEELDRVRTATEGQRNDTLNRSAFSLYQLVAGGELPESSVTNGLETCAEAAGLDPSEIGKTLASARKAGFATPRRQLGPAHGSDLRSAQSQAHKPKRRFSLTNSNDLLAARFEPVKWTVPDYLPEGLSVLAGRQKLGKTWLAIDWSVAVATGGMAMAGIEVEEGDVLYIDMENGGRRIQRRINTIFPFEKPDLSRLTWATDTIPLNDGFLDAVDHWRRSVCNPRLIVIDVLQRIKPPGSRSSNAYENDYAAFSELQAWATKHGISVLALHHTRKGGADDKLEALSGSNGLSACADTTLVLDRDTNGITLYVRGRDVEEVETALRFDGGLWTIQGEAHEVRRSEQRSLILSTLLDTTEPMTPSVIADVTGMKASNIRRLLHTMLRAGEVQKMGRGKYVHPENKHLVTENPERAGPGNNGNVPPESVGS